MDNDFPGIITAQNVEIILSKGKAGYIDVISELTRDNHLYLSTFNYSMPDDFDELIKSKIEFVNDIKVIFNVYHYEGKEKEKISQLLRRSLNKNPFVQFFYDSSNHSKIISNGEQMYIGSSNVTGNSKNNFEAGVLIKDKDVIKEVEYKVFEIAHLRCTPIFSEPIYPVILPFLFILQESDKNYSYFKYLVDFSRRSNSITEDDLSDSGNRIKQYLCNYLVMFREAKEAMINYAEGMTDKNFILENLFDEIEKNIDSLSDEVLGSYINSHFDFLEDYKNTLKEYKDHYWRLNTFHLEENLLKEQLFILKIKSILAMLYHLRIKWIETIGIQKQAVFLDERIPILFWLEEPSMANTYWRYFISK